MSPEQRIAAIIGDLVIKNATMAFEIEAAQARIVELEKKVPKEPKPSATNGGAHPLGKRTRTPSGKVPGATAEPAA